MTRGHVERAFDDTNAASATQPPSTSLKRIYSDGDRDRINVTHEAKRPAKLNTMAVFSGVEGGDASFKHIPTPMLSNASGVLDAFGKRSSSTTLQCIDAASSTTDGNMLVRRLTSEDTFVDADSNSDSYDAGTSASSTALDVDSDVNSQMDAMSSSMDSESEHGPSCTSSVNDESEPECVVYDMPVHFPSLFLQYSAPLDAVSEVLALEGVSDASPATSRGLNDKLGLE